MHVIFTAWSTKLKSDSQPLARSICMLSYAMPTIQQIFNYACDLHCMVVKTQIGLTTSGSINRTTCNASCQDCGTLIAMLRDIPATHPAIRQCSGNFTYAGNSCNTPRHECFSHHPSINLLPSLSETCARDHGVSEDSEKQQT